MPGLLLAMALITVPAMAETDGPSAEDLRIAQSLATMLQSARAVISAHQAEINDPAIGIPVSVPKLTSV